MTENKIVIENPKSTVIANYQAEERTETQYQGEPELEKVFIQRLQGQAYEYLPLHTEQDLISQPASLRWRSSMGSPLTTPSGSASTPPS
jgi:hypothetical protein